MAKYDDAVFFFYDNAGYAYDPKTQTEEEGRTETANRLALAEAFAKEAELTFTWDWDDEPGEQFCRCDQLPSAVFYGIDAGGADEVDADYRRVVEAEIASELVPWKAVRAFGESMALKFT